MRFPFIASAAAISVFVLGINTLGKSPEEQAESFRVNYPTKDACLGGGAERIARCQSPNCYSGVSLFMQRCLEQADGDKQTFCNNIAVLYDSEGRDIFPTHCAQHTPYEAECDKLIGYTNAYCSAILTE